MLLRHFYRNAHRFVRCRHRRDDRSHRRDVVCGLCRRQLRRGPTALHDRGSLLSTRPRRADELEPRSNAVLSSNDHQSLGQPHDRRWVRLLPDQKPLLDRPGRLDPHQWSLGRLAGFADDARRGDGTTMKLPGTGRPMLLASATTPLTSTEPRTTTTDAATSRAQFPPRATTRCCQLGRDPQGDAYGGYAERERDLHRRARGRFCGDVGRLPAGNTWTFHRTLAFGGRATGALAHDPTPGYWGSYSTPRPSLLLWFPDLTAGSYTSTSQAAYSVDGRLAVRRRGRSRARRSTTARSRDWSDSPFLRCTPNKQGPRVGSSQSSLEHAGLVEHFRASRLRRTRTRTTAT